MKPWTSDTSSRKPEGSLNPGSAPRKSTRSPGFGKAIEAAIKWIRSITDEPEVGVIYQGTVVKTADFGAFVNFFGPKDGLVHISQLANDRVAKTSDVVKEGQKVFVKLMGFDERGKVRLSMKVVDQETGKELAREKRAEGEDAA